MSYFDPSPREVNSSRYAAMLKQLRTWAYWQIGVGLLSLIVPSVMDPVWGVLLIAVGIASFFVKDAAMFIVYGVTFAWAMINNILASIGSSTPAWAGFGIVQGIIVISIFGGFGHNRKTQSDHEAFERSGDQPVPTASKVARAFPLAGVALSVAAFLGVGLLFIAFFVIFGFFGANSLPPIWVWGLGMVVNFGVLGLALSIASLMSHFPFKPASLIGVVVGGIVLLLFILISILP